MRYELHLEESITLSSYRTIDRIVVDTEDLQYDAMQLARSYFGKNIILRAHVGSLGFSIHDKGPIVAPNSSFLGNVWTEKFA